MDKLKLEYYIKSKGFTAEEISNVLGISKSAFYRKMNQTTEFTRNEIEILIKTLEIKDPVSIFFTSEVS